MTKIIQQVVINKDVNLYITEINLEEQKMKYRLSSMPAILMEEFFKVKDDKCSLPLYFFHVHYVNNFLKLNQE